MTNREFVSDWIEKDRHPHRRRRVERCQSSAWLALGLVLAACTVDGDSLKTPTVESTHTDLSAASTSSYLEEAGVILDGTTTSEVVPEDATPLEFDYSLSYEEGAGAAPDNQRPTHDVSSQRGMVELLEIYRRDIVSQWAQLFDGLEIRHPDTNFEWVEAGETVTTACRATRNGPLLVLQSDFPNAIYCPADNTIYMPVESFIKAYVECDLFGRPAVCDDMAIGGVMAHEYGHAITFWLRDGLQKKGYLIFGPTGKNRELFPDCLAGMYFRTLRSREFDDDGDYEALVKIMGALGDVGFSLDPHGTPTERRNAIVLGADTNQFSRCTSAYGIFVVGELVSVEITVTTSPPVGIVREITAGGYEPPAYDGTGESGLSYMTDVLRALITTHGGQIPETRYFFELADSYDFCGYPRRSALINAQSIFYCTESEPTILVGKLIFDSVHESHSRIGELAGVLLIAWPGALHVASEVPALSRVDPSYNYLDCLSGAWLGSYSGSEVQNADVLAAYQAISNAFEQVGIRGSPIPRERQNAFLQGFSMQSCSDL